MKTPVSFDRQFPEAIADPYPLYRRLQDEAPVHWSERLHGWVLSRYDDVKLGLGDPRFSTDWMRTPAAQRQVADSSPLGRMYRTFTRWMSNVDPPQHTRLRALASHAFTSRAVERLRPRIQALVDEALDRVAPSGRMELMADLAAGLPVRVIGELMGVPPEDHPQLKAWSDDLTMLVGNTLPRPGKLDGALAAIDGFSDYFRRQVAERRRTPGEDLLSALVAARDRGDLLNEDELVDTATFIIGAGHETTTYLIGNSVHGLLRQPAAFEQLRAAGRLTEAAVDELLRYDGPVQVMQRIVREPLELHGTPLEAGQVVHLLLGAANRDPRQFAEPDRLDLERRSAAHLGFGHGPHYCLGAPLARLEVSIAVGTIARRFPRLELEGGPPPWTDALKFRGPLELPLVLRP